MIYTESICRNTRATSDSAVVNGIVYMKAKQFWPTRISVRKGPAKAVSYLQTEQMFLLVPESSKEHIGSILKKTSLSTDILFTH